MKLVFGHLTISPKSDSKPFDHNDIALDSAALQSANWIMKESQNRVLSDSKGNEEDAGQIPMKTDGNGVAASRFDCSKSVDDLERCNKDEVKGFVSPYNLSSEKLDSLEKASDYYMDKSVMECELPEFMVCYRESNFNTIKDICVDEGVPSQDKLWVETGVDDKAFCTSLSPQKDQNKQLLEEQRDILMSIPDGFKSSAKNDLEMDFLISCDSKDLMQKGQAINDASEKTEIDVSKDWISPANALSMEELGGGNFHSKDLMQNGEAIYDASEKAAIDVSKDMISPENARSMEELGAANFHSKDLMQSGEAIFDASEKTEIDVSRDWISPSNALSMEELGGGNFHSKDLMQNGEAIYDASEKAAIDVSKDMISPENARSMEELGAANFHSKDLMQSGEATYDASEKTAIDVSKDIISSVNALSMEESGTANLHSKSSNKDNNDSVEATVQVSSEKGSEMDQTESTALVSATEESNNSETEALASLAPVSLAEESNCLVRELSSAPLSITRDMCPQNGFHEHLENQNLSGDDVEISDSKIVSSQVQHSLAPVTIAREESPDNGVREHLETQDMSVDDDISHSKIVSSQVQHFLAPVTIAREESPKNGVCQRPESSNKTMVEDGNSDTYNASFRVQYGPGESSFSAVAPLSSLLNNSGRIAYSGSVSLRSDSSTTSTRSFAFPVLQPEWNSSPVRMAKADRRHMPKNRGWRQVLVCCRF